MQRRNFLSSLLAAFVPPVSGRADPRFIGPDPSGDPLSSWLRFPIQPVWDRPDLHILDAPDHPFFEILRSIRNRQPLTIHYRGGTRPGTNCLISPALVFQKLRQTPVDPATEPYYVLAWCHRRQELRTFRLDRISLPDSGLNIAYP